MEGITMIRKDTLPQDNRATTHQPRYLRPRRACSRRSPACGAVAAHASASGQSLLEFALVLPVFMLLTLGLLDGMRVIFYYSQVQEAARLGVRWGSVQVGRAVPLSNTQASTTDAVGGTFAITGNAPGTYCDLTPPPSPPCDYSLQGSRWTDPANPVTNTIVGAVTLGTTAVNLSQATIAISTTMPTTGIETADIDNSFTNQPVTVTVTYPFTPILSMGLGAVTLRGSSSMLHE
jgi:Flp pilus assembly protein TadG